MYFNIHIKYIEIDKILMHRILTNRIYKIVTIKYAKIEIRIHGILIDKIHKL